MDKFQCPDADNDLVRLVHPKPSIDGWEKDGGAMTTAASLKSGGPETWPASFGIGREWVAPPPDHYLEGTLAYLNPMGDST